jgi:hypothetical protein
MTNAAGDELRPEQEQSVQEFARELGLGDVDVPEGVRVSQAYGAGYGAGYADGEGRARGIAAHPAGRRRPTPPRSAVVRTLVLEAAAVGVAWFLGSLLGESAARSMTEPVR